MTSTGQSAEMRRDEIEEQLLYELRGIKHADLFTGASAVDLVMGIRRGAATMVEQARTSNDDLNQARHQLHVLLAEMDNAKASRGLSEFQEETVNAAFMSLCPRGFWPFC
jgi:hypothetical protein